MDGDWSPALIGCISFFLALSWLFVLLRCYCRAVLVKSFGLDDIFCLVAQILFTGYCASVRSAIANGVGQHVADIPPSNISSALKWLWISDPFYMFCNMTLKFSIGIFLLRICVERLHRVILWCVIVFSGIVCICCDLIAIFQCWPVTYFWEQGSTAEGSCVRPIVMIVTTIIPIFMIWDLQMHLQAKICVCLVLGISSIASIITIVRIPSIAALNGGNDFLYTVAELTLWSICETGLALTASAAATLRPLIRVLSRNFDTYVPDDIKMRSSRIATQQDPWSYKNGRLDGNQMGIQTEVRTHAVGIDGDANHLSRWPEDDQSSSAEADRISNSSQAKLKSETGLVVTETVMVTRSEILG